MYTIKEELKSLIVYEIEHVFGRRVVSSRDCIELSEDIFNKTRHQLNPHTLRRVFNLVKADYPPSKSTLTILSNYCGYASIDEVYKMKNNNTREEGVINPEAVLQYLVSLFRNLDINDVPEGNLFILATHTIKFLNANKSIIEKFQSLIAKTENAVNFYYEQLVNVDKLNSFYGRGLRFYVHEKNSPEAEIFYASIQIMKHWLNGENDELLKYSDILAVDVEKIAVMHPYVKVRYYAALLYYCQISGASSENTRIEIYNLISNPVSKANASKYRYYFTYVIAETLLLTGFPEEALFYINAVSKADSAMDKNKPLSFPQGIKLIESMSLMKTGREEEAEMLFNEIRSSEFVFLNKKFSSILYFSLLNKIKKRDRMKKYKKELDTLINETGFYALRDY